MNTDSTHTTTDTATATADTPTPAATPPAGEAPPSPQPEAGDGKAHREAARYRTQLREAEGQLAEANARIAAYEHADRLRELTRKHGLTDTDAAILAVVPADKVEQVAAQLAAKAEEAAAEARITAEAARIAGNKHLASYFGAGTPIPTSESDADQLTWQGAIRAAQDR